MGKFSVNKLHSDVLVELALKHKLLRKKHKFSRAAELASRSGVSLGSIKRFGQTVSISFESLLKLAHLLGKLDDFNELFAINDDENIAQLFSDKARTQCG